MSSDVQQRFWLGPWQVEPPIGAVTGPNGETQHLEPKVMDVLALLAQHPNKLVSRDQLLDAVWSGHVAADELLTRAISELRRALNDDRGDPRYIETIPKRGYRLIGDIYPPDGTSFATDLPPTESITRLKRHKWAFIIVTVLALVLVYFAYDEFAIEREPEETAATTKTQLEDVIETGRWQKSIAVLPFVNMSDDPGNEYFSDGLSEEIMNLLTRVPGLKVIGRTSSFAFKGKNEDLRVIGQKLAVNTLLEGSVRKSGDSVRIVAQLIDASDGTHIWSDTYDRTLTDIFAVQDDIASAVVDALEIHVTPVLSRGSPTDNWEAYNFFLKARLAINRLEWLKAATLLERTLQLDPQFAEAHELLAYSYWYAAYNGVDAEVAQRRAYEVASTAIAINPDLIFAQVIHRSGNVGSSSILGDLDAGEWAYRQQPDNPQVLDSLIYTLTYAGYKEEAVRIAQRYAEVDPLSLDANLDLFGALYSAGRVEEAMQTLEIINQIGLGPSNWQWTIAGTKLAEGDDEAAIDYFEALLHLYDYPDSGWVREFVTAARDPVSGQAYLDRRIPEIAASLSEEDNFNWRTGLINWYLYFGFIDRYFELILAANPAVGAWSDADEQLWHGHAFRRLGFTAHPGYLRLATDLGIVDVWDQRGPPDFCLKNVDNWICD